MKKYLLICLVGVAFLSSCNDSSNKNSSTEQIKASEETSQTNTVNEPIETIEFEVVNINGGQFENYQDNNVNFRTELDIKNQTNSKITNLDIFGFLELVFEDGTLRFHPGDNYQKSEDDYFKKIYQGVKPRVSPTINQNNPWKPNEIRKFLFNVPSDAPYSYNLDISKGEFQRTPKEAVFAFKYKAISIDGEYSDIKKYDILDSWKDYQRKLNLR